MTRVLVLGGFGFIGQNLAAALVRAGVHTDVVTRSAAERATLAASLGVGLVQLSAFGTPDAARLLVAQYDTVYLLIGGPTAVRSNARPLDSLDPGCVEPLAWLHACAESGHRPHVVFASSRLVYGRPDSLPVAESHALRPLSIYAAHKCCAEHYHEILALSGRLTFTICRLSNTYGPSPPHHGVINQMFDKAMKGEPITVYGTGSQLRDSLHVDDTVAALLAGGLVPAARNQIFNIGSGHGVALRAVAEAIAQRMGTPLHFVPWPADAALVEDGDYVADISKARRMLGFSPAYTLHAGIDETLEQIRRQVRTPAVA